MRITRVKVNNYKNIDGVTVIFNPECSYIIGENNIGKSNFLSLLSTVCSGRGFGDEDFFDTEKPIEVELEIKLLPNELGFFGDNFSPDDSSLVRILCIQTIGDAYPTIVCADSKEGISPKQLRKINFQKYETTSIPSKELRLNTQRGMGLLVSSIIERFITGSEEVPAFLNDKEVDRLAEFINEHLGKIRIFRDYDIKATTAPNPLDMLTSLFYLSDGDRKIDSMGSGVQYLAMASISILCQIMYLYKSKSIPFEERLYTDDGGRTLLPLVLSIDEPEVHLHPYLQRSLINFYQRILHNEDAEFNKLLKPCFGIDGIDGQLIIVTHSTDVLVGDYRNLVRFYKNGDKTSVISGANPSLDISKKFEKHLIMRFPEIREAFYAHCAILVEGETEYGCIHAFASKLGVPLDDYAICVINARGTGSINPLRQLLAAFSVPSIAIYDGDVKAGRTPSVDEFYTSEACFEIEIVKTLFAKSQAALIKQIALDLDDDAKTVSMDVDFVRKHFKKMKVDMEGYVPKTLKDVSDEDEEDFCRMYSAWFMANKGVLIGRVIGDILPAAHIPSCFVSAIKRAQEVASNV